jgi:hypothetical protein
MNGSDPPSSPGVPPQPARDEAKHTGPKPPAARPRVVHSDPQRRPLLRSHAKSARLRTRGTNGMRGTCRSLARFRYRGATTCQMHPPRQGFRPPGIPGGSRPRLANWM